MVKVNMIQNLHMNLKGYYKILPDIKNKNILKNVSERKKVKKILNTHRIKILIG